MIFWAGKHPTRSPAFHVVLHGNGIGYGGGEFGFEPPALNDLRDRLCQPADRRLLLDAINTAASVGCLFDAPDLVRLPKRFSADGDWEHLLRRKAMVLRTLDDLALPTWIHTGRAVGEFTRIAKALSPLLDWLTRAK
jgi:uncharacterized protein (DUF2461 family)